MSIFLIILGFVLFIGLVVAHEWGHFIAARRAGVEVEEFGIGFPPKAWGKKIETKKSKFLLSVNWLPLGGFVRLKGENDAATAKGSYGAASLPDKTKIMVAGVVMNFLVAYIMFVIIALIGMPQIVPDQFNIASDSKVTRQVENKNKTSLAKVVSGSPADKAGLKEGDVVQLINGNKITNPAQI
ncbi:MAG: site-2 protease family protein, partial [Patescibacteria group bacterium]